MNETLTEAITRNLLERNELFAVARELVDKKIKNLIPHLENGSKVSIRKFYMDIPEFEVHSIDGIEIFIKDSEKVVVISKNDIKEAFKIVESTSSNSIKFEDAMEAIYLAFYGIPHRCPYFELGHCCLSFETFIR